MQYCGYVLVTKFLARGCNIASFRAILKFLFLLRFCLLQDPDSETCKQLRFRLHVVMFIVYFIAKFFVE